MQFLLLQTFVCMLLAGLLGAILGCVAHRFLGAQTDEAVVVPAAVAAAAAASAPVAARVIPKAPVVEASKAPAPVAPAAPATVPDRASAYTYPVTTVGIPRSNPELVQPQIQTINLPAAAAAGAGSVAAAVTIRQAAAPTAHIYPITTVGIPQGYVEPSMPVAVKPAGDAARFERALTGEQAQPRPEPLRPELGRSAPVAAPAAAVPAKPVAPSVAATVAPAAPAPVAPAAAVAATAAAPAAVAPVAPAAPVAKVPNAPIESKPAGIVAGAPPIGPIASKPAGIPAAAKPTTTEAPVAVKPAAAADVPFEPVVAGGAALAAIAARAASAQAAAAAAANAASLVPAAPAPVVAAPVAPTPVPPTPVPAKPAAAAAAPAVPAASPAVAATGGDDLMRIRAIDAVMQTRLKGAGVMRFSEIARWTPGDVARISQTMGFTGRIEQENWIEQAQILATGGETDYSRRRARGEIPAAAAAAAAAVAPAAAKVAPVAPAAPAPAKAVGDAPAVAAVAPAAPVKPAAASGADTSVAAATAAAAAMASAAITRATANVEPSMPSKLVDAIRENLAKPAAAVAAAAAPVVAAASAADAGRVSRPDLAGLRSVRSEALRDTSPAGRGTGANEDLKRIRGIGVLIEKKLNSLGITGYEQIANWTIADIDRVSQILDFKGRIERENWVEQARILASGGQTEFSKRVDRGEA